MKTEKQISFQEDLKLFRAENPLAHSKISNRIDGVIPKLRLKTVGRYTYIEGLKALSSITSRTLDYVRQTMIKIIGCPIQVVDEDQVRLKSGLTLKRVRNFEKRYLNEKVICRVCLSPQTNYKDGFVWCVSCGDRREES